MQYAQINGRGQAIDELRNAFDSVERSSPGMADEVVEALIGQLVGRDLPWNAVDAAIQKTKR